MTDREADHVAELLATTPGFSPPKNRQPSQDPIDPERTTVEEADPIPLGPIGSTTASSQSRSQPADSSGAGAGDWPPEDPSWTPPNVGPHQVVTSDPAAFEGLIGTTLRLGGAALDHKLTPHSHAWLPDDDDVAAISEPLSRIVARHAPIKAGDETNDLIDGIEAGVASVGYVLKSQQRAAERAAWEQQQAQNDSLERVQ